ncbi:MAG: hypothetical protein Q9213_004055 [Squamulea squamosa]
MSISRSFISCLQSFNGLIIHIKSPGYVHGDDVPIAIRIDELGRFRIWAANVGAHQTGQSSLEFRLRDASHIREESVNLLRGLEGLLTETKEYITEGPFPDEELLHDETFNEEPITEIRSLFDAIVNVIQCLYKLAILIRNPAQRDFLTQSRRSDTSAFEPYDLNHVRDRFPQADEELVLRLGKAITRRRGYFKYQERHNTKLGKGLEEALSHGEPAAGTGSISETMASSFEPQFRDFDEAESSGSSQTSCASVFDSDTIILPALPREAMSGRPFVCPFCFCILNIETTRLWHRHIYLDLRPYVCLVRGCRIPDRLYSSRRDWFAHVCDMQDVAVADLVCPLCGATQQTVKQYERHLGRHCEELALLALPSSGGDEEDDGEAKSSDAAFEDECSRSSAPGVNTVNNDWHDSNHQIAEVESSSSPTAPALNVSTLLNASPRRSEADDPKHEDPANSLASCPRLQRSDPQIIEDSKRRIDGYNERGEEIFNLYRREMEELSKPVNDNVAQSNFGKKPGHS